MRTLRAAFMFLTRLPVGGFPYTERELRGAAGWFPLVGAVVALVEGVAFRLTRDAGAMVAATVAVATGILLTGALHEDGLADTADALGGARDEQGVFRILKDSRIGAFGATALVMAILLRVGLLAHLDGAAPAALVLVRSASRAAPVWMMACTRYVTPEGRSKHVTRAGATQVMVATATTLLIAGGALFFRRVPSEGAVSAGAAVVALTVVLCAWFRARVGGVTGDFLGATQQACEVAMLLALSLSKP